MEAGQLEDPRDMSRITDNIYLSCEPTDDEVALLKSFNITHILSMTCAPLPKNLTSNFNCKFVYILDSDDADLLTALQECLPFMHLATEEGVVLVHCMMGISRSTSAIVAFLMQRDGMSLNSALRLVRSKRSFVCPNPGFMEQLRIFEDMGAKFDPKNPQYKNYRMTRIANLHDQSRRAQEINDYVGTVTPDSGDKSMYKCRKCRYVLFRAENLLPHAASGQRAQFDKKMRGHRVRRELGQGSGSVESGEGCVCDRSIFIEPVPWLKEDIQTHNGKIFCPKCKAKLGSFDWSGSQCPCGSWITPSFHIQAAKVDHIPIVKVPPDTTIPQPNCTDICLQLLS